MRATRFFIGSIAGACLAVLAATTSLGVNALQQGETVAVDADDIGGVVSSTRGPEAGVWVIAETTDLPTKFVRMVVTDDRGRYLVPDLPKASYNVWVRGYGLVDSRIVRSAPGKPLNLTATIAPDAKSAAEYYPSNYWYSLMQVPAKSEFPGTGPGGNGISKEIASQGEWVDMLKTDRLSRLSPGWRQGVARDSQEPRRVRFVGGRLGAPSELGTGWQRDDRPHQHDGQGARARGVRQLDRPDRGRRAAAGASAAAGHRAQPGRQHVGLGDAADVLPRRDLHRQAEPDA